MPDNGFLLFIPSVRRVHTFFDAGMFEKFECGGGLITQPFMPYTTPFQAVLPW
jgi:hypothetical protein